MLYFLVGRAGMLAATDGSMVTPIWPASGLALVAVLIGGYPMAVGLALGSCVLNLTQGLSPLVSIVIALGNNFEYLGGAYLLRRVAGFHLELDRPRDIAALMFLGAGSATTFSAFPGLAILILEGVESPDHMGWLFLRWWQGGMAGVLIVAPLLLVWRKTPATHPPARFGMARALEASALLLLLMAVWWLIFDISTPSGHGYYPSILAVFPFTIWGALRFGVRGATLVNLITAALGIWGTALGTGPFAGDSPSDSLVRWCLFTNAVAMTGLFLASASTEKRRVQWALEESHAELERKVESRTAALREINEGLQREAAERQRLEAELLGAAEDHQRRFGMELHDGLGQHLTSIAFFGAALRQRLEAQGLPEADAARRIEVLLNEAIDTVRALASGLFPASLTSEGLPVALGQLAETTHTLDHVVCDFEATPAISVPDPLVAINLYRMTQEAVSNAIKHGKAHRVFIRLEKIEDQYRLIVTDDGVGFDPSEYGSQPKVAAPSPRPRTPGMGLRNLYYRASLLGGSVSIHSQPEQGTTVTVRCPAGSLS